MAFTKRNGGKELVNGWKLVIFYLRDESTDMWGQAEADIFLYPGNNVLSSGQQSFKRAYTSHTK